MKNKLTPLIIGLLISISDVGFCQTTSTIMVDTNSIIQRPRAFWPTTATNDPAFSNAVNQVVISDTNWFGMTNGTLAFPLNLALATGLPYTAITSAPWLTTAAYNAAWGAFSTNILSSYLLSATYTAAFGTFTTNSFGSLAWSSVVLGNAAGANTNQFLGAGPGGYQDAGNVTNVPFSGLSGNFFASNTILNNGTITITNLGMGSTIKFNTNDNSLYFIRGSDSMRLSAIVNSWGANATWKVDAPGVVAGRLNFDTSGNLGIGHSTAMSGSYNLYLAGSLMASNGVTAIGGTFTGDAGGLTGIPATNFVGVVSATNLPTGYSFLLISNVNIPLMEVNPPPTSSVGNSDPPFSTSFPVLKPIGGTVFAFQIPDWVTGAVISIKYEWSGALPLTWTNRGGSYASLSGVGMKNTPDYLQYQTFTLPPTNIVWVNYTNRWPDAGGTNCVKRFQFYGFNVPTNTDKNVWITQIRATYTGNFTGTNF